MRRTRDIRPQPIVRRLTDGECELARSIFGDSIALDKVTIRRRRWMPFQPKRMIMAPSGHIHVHPKSAAWSDDYSRESLGLQGLFVHELCHVWQAQARGKFYLPLMRHPFCRYRYRLQAGRRFENYGLEQQAEIVRHVFLLRRGYPLSGAPPLDRLEALLPF